MPMVVSMLLSTIGVSVTALTLLILIVWFGGDFLRIPKSTQFIVIIVLVMIFVIFAIAKMVLKRKRAKAIENQMGADADQQMSGSRPADRQRIAEVKKQLDDAIATLKASKMGKSALYSLPWYMIIGPPGSGKTTALLESNLNFPYQSQGRRGIGGVGGTRNCDWWFAEKAILLDTAGRYTTQMEDRNEWLSFLGMIKKTRPNTPINGAIVAISIPDVIQGSDQQLLAHADNIRNRLDELSKELEAVFPVYLVFTKCDLIEGFTDLFEDYGEGQRNQVWGITLPYDEQSQTSYEATFAQGSGELLQRLETQRISALSTDRPPQKKQRIFTFPLQFGQARAKLARFVGMVFQPNPYQETPTLRGYYFTSGTQEGAPIDQVLQGMQSAFGLNVPTAGPAVHQGTKKSYFISDLFSKVVFGDADLARSSSGAVKRRKRSRMISKILLILMTLGFSGFLTTQVLKRRDQATEATDAVQRIGEARTTNDEERQAFLQSLDQLRQTIDVLKDDSAIGLYAANDDLRGDIRELYRKRFNRYLTDRCAKRLRDDVVGICSAKSADDLQEFRGRWPDLSMSGASRFGAARKALDLLESMYPPKTPEIERIADLNAEEDFWSRNWQEKRAPSRDLRKLARQQLEFYREQGWVLAPDEAHLRTANDAYLEAIRNAKEFPFIKRYEELFSTWQRDSGKREPAATTLGINKYRDWIDMPDQEQLVPEFYANNYWDRVLRPELVTIVREYLRGLPPGSETTEGQCMEIIAGYHKKRRESIYADFFTGVRFQGLLPDGQVDQLNALGDEHSFLRDLFKPLWGQRSFIQQTGLTRVDSPRLGRILEAVQHLKDAVLAVNEVQRILEEAGAGAPTPERLTVASNQVKAAQDLLSKARTKRDGDDRPAVNETTPPRWFAESVLSGCLESVRIEVDKAKAELESRGDDLKKKRALETRTRTVAAINDEWNSLRNLILDQTRLYPFRRSARKSIPLSRLELEIKPKGLIDKEIEKLREGIKKKLLDTKDVQALVGKIEVEEAIFARIQQRMNRMQRALGIDEGGSIGIPFQAEIEPDGKGIDAGSLAIVFGKRRLEWAPGHKLTRLQWPPREAGPASITWKGAQAVLPEQMDDETPWALFRLLEKASRATDKERSGPGFDGELAFEWIHGKARPRLHLRDVGDTAVRDLFNYWTSSDPERRVFSWVELPEVLAR